MINPLTPESLAELVSTQQGPCLSLHQPTHRHHPDNQQDPIRFGNLVRQLAASLLEKHSPAEVKPLLEPFEALARDRTFWDHTLDGLAVLSGSGLVRAFLLQRSVDERVVVADSFHTKPLRRMLRSLDRHQVLELSRHHIRLFEGNRDALDEIEPAPGVPRTIEDALGAEFTEPQQRVSAHGGVGQGRPPMHHSTGGKKDEVEVSRNPLLAADGISLNTAALSLDEIRALAWQAVEPGVSGTTDQSGRGVQTVRSEATRQRRSGPGGESGGRRTCCYAADRGRSPTARPDRPRHGPDRSRWPQPPGGR